MRLRRHILTSSGGALDPPCSTLHRWHNSRASQNLGGVVERLMAPVLKTGRAQALVGSNPTPSAISQNFGSSVILPAIFAFEPGDSNAVRLVGRVTRQG